MSQSISLWGGIYSSVPAVQLPKQGGGTARFDDCSVVTAQAADVASGKIFVASDGTITTGTNSGGGSVTVKTATMTNSDNTAKSIRFTGLSAEPTAFFVRTTTQISSSGSTSYYYVIAVDHHGTSTQGNCFRIGSTRRVQNVTSGYSYTYSGGTLTVSSSGSRTAAPGSFYNGSYSLTYVY